MREQVKIDGLEGKTIEKVSCNYDRMLISFTDKTFAALVAQRSYDGEEIVDEPFSWGRYADSELAAMDIASWDEIKAQRDEENRQAEQRQQDYERQQYEKLKAKFEQDSLRRP